MFVEVGLVEDILDSKDAILSINFFRLEMAAIVSQIIIIIVLRKSAVKQVEWIQDR